MGHTIRVGAVVRVMGIPDLDAMPEDTKAAFRAALGREFRVVGHGPYGHVELELGPGLDAELGGFMNSIWIEADLVEELR
jgi:hypothetical protein